MDDIYQYSRCANATSLETCGLTRYVQFLPTVGCCVAVNLLCWFGYTTTIMNITTRAQAAKRKQDTGLELVQTPKLVHLSKSSVQCVPVPTTPSDRSDVNDQSKTVSSMQVRDFALNRDQNLLKKSMACNLPPIQVEIKDMGKQTVITCNTGTYEVTKLCLKDFFESGSRKLGIKESVASVDENGANVEDTLKIFNRKANGDIGNVSKYTVNLYHTTSKILVNGKGHNSFVEDDFPEIMEALKRKLPEAHKLNSILREALEACRASRSSRSSTNTRSKEIKSKYSVASAGTQKVSAVHTGRLPVATRSQTKSAPSIQKEDDRISQADDEENAMCISCSDPNNDYMVECDSCGNWYHYGCEGISVDYGNELFSNDSLKYFCHACQEDGKHTGTSTNNPDSPFLESSLTADDNDDVRSNDDTVDDCQKTPKQGATAIFPSVPANDDSSATGVGDMRGAKLKKTAPPVKNIPDISPLKIADLSVRGHDTASAGEHHSDLNCMTNLSVTLSSSNPTKAKVNSASKRGSAMETSDPPKGVSLKKRIVDQKKKASKPVGTTKTKDIHDLTENDSDSLRKALKKVEKDLKETQSRYETGQRYIKRLESQLSEAEKSNRILRTQAAANMGKPPQTAPTYHLPAQHQPNYPPNIDLRACVNAAEIVVLKHRLSLLEQRYGNYGFGMWPGGPHMMPYLPSMIHQAPYMTPGPFPWQPSMQSGPAPGFPPPGFHPPGPSQQGFPPPGFPPPNYPNGADRVQASNVTAASGASKLKSVNPVKSYCSQEAEPLGHHLVKHQLNECASSDCARARKSSNPNLAVRTKDSRASDTEIISLQGSSDSINSVVKSVKTVVTETSVIDEAEDTDAIDGRLSTIRSSSNPVTGVKGCIAHRGRYDVDSHGRPVSSVGMDAGIAVHNEGSLSTLRSFSDPVTSVKRCTSSNRGPYGADGQGSSAPIISMDATEDDPINGRLSTLRSFSDSVTSVQGCTSDGGPHDADGDFRAVSTTNEDTVEGNHSKEKTGHHFLGHGRASNATHRN